MNTSARERDERSAGRPELPDVILGTASVMALILLLVWAVA